jgi:Tfp pilus assembly protein PilV
MRIAIKGWRHAPRRGEIWHALADDQGGASLVSQLVALAIISITLSVLVAALYTSGSGALLVRQRVSAQNLARQHMEEIKAADYPQAPYVAQTPQGYMVDVEVYGIEDGLQRITVRVSSKSSGQLLCTLEGYKRRVSI